MLMRIIKYINFECIILTLSKSSFSQKTSIFKDENIFNLWKYNFVFVTRNGEWRVKYIRYVGWVCEDIVVVLKALFLVFWKTMCRTVVKNLIWYE